MKISWSAGLRSLAFIFLFLEALGCAHSHNRDHLRDNSMDCGALFKDQSYETAEDLQIVSALFAKSCYAETITLGKRLRDKSRDKFFSIMAETGELFTPEGTFTPYVLESYERAYLSLLLAVSYTKLDRQEDAAVELRRSYAESTAILYNYGDDDINWALQAILWENLQQPQESRPLWLRVSQSQNQNMPELQKLATTRVERLDDGSWKDHPLRIRAFGQQPKLDWHFSTDPKSDGYFRIAPIESFPAACLSDQSALIPTQAWSDKVAKRNRLDYHPLVNIKSWTRLPFGVLSGAVTFATGVGIGVGGCSLAVASAKYGGANDATARLCAYSIQAAAGVASESGPVVNYILQPDLRRWESLPAAFLFVEGEDPAKAEGCTPSGRGRSEERVTLESLLLL